MPDDPPCESGDSLCPTRPDLIVLMNLRVMLKRLFRDGADHVWALRVL